MSAHLKIIAQTSTQCTREYIYITISIPILQLEVDLPLPADIPWPPPLDEGISLEIYEKHIAPPDPETSPEVRYDSAYLFRSTCTNQNSYIG